MADGVFLNVLDGLLATINIRPKAEVIIKKEIVPEMLRHKVAVAHPVGDYVRLAGLSGGLALIVNVYGTYVFQKKYVDASLVEAFELANRCHIMHSLALLGVPLTRRPIVTGSLLTAGMVLFCGSCYYHAFTGKSEIRSITPYGGFLLILAWFSMTL